MVRNSDMGNRFYLPIGRSEYGSCGALKRIETKNQNVNKIDPTSNNFQQNRPKKSIFRIDRRRQIATFWLKKNVDTKRKQNCDWLTPA